jgi:hypothetical protein
MKGFHAAIIITTLLLSACSAVGRYQQNTVFIGHSIEIRADHTFLYNSWSDTIVEGEDTSAVTGTWAPVGRRTIVTTAAPSTHPERLPFAAVQRWRLTPRGLVTDSGIELRRQ